MTSSFSGLSPGCVVSEQMFSVIIIMVILTTPVIPLVLMCLLQRV